MSIDSYIEDRVKNQISWYSKKSQAAQHKYKVAQVIEIIVAAVIPLLSSYAGKCWTIALIIGIGGCVITAIEGIERLYKWHDIWIEYRTTSELLKYHLHMYETTSGLYSNEPESFESMFVSNIENIISSENNKWKLMNELPKKENKKEAK